VQNGNSIQIFEIIKKEMGAFSLKFRFHTVEHTIPWPTIDFSAVMLKYESDQIFVHG
jgi:hypothetical protein